jgi:sugar phosphate permease
MLVDSIGVRYTAALGTAVAGVGSILFGLSPTIFTMYIGRFLVGAGVSVIYISILKIQSCWFYDREFGTLTGLTNIFGNLGGIIAQTPLVALVSLLTWRYSFVAIGILGLIVAVLCLLIVRNKPSGIGLSSVDNIEIEGINFEKTNIFKGLKKVCLNLYTWPVFILFAGFYGPFLALTGTWGQSYLKNVYGMNEIEAANYIVLPILGYAIGSLAIGWLSDWALNRKITMLIQGTIYLLSWLILVLVFKGKPPVAFLGILLFIMGFSVSSYIPGYALAKEINDPQYVGVSTAVVNSGGFIGAAIVPLAMGKVLVRYSNFFGMQQLYNKAFMICLVSAAIGYTFIFFLKETNCSNIYYRLICSRSRQHKHKGCGL